MQVQGDFFSSDASFGRIDITIAGLIFIFNRVLELCTVSKWNILGKT